MPSHTQTPYRKKLIEVDLPLDAINKESSREKSIRHGHPSTLHLWWSRKPLAACRAVIFASMVDDPSSCPEEFPDIASQSAKRQELHDLIEQLVKWENSNDENLLSQARTEIARSVARSRDEIAPVKPKEILDYLRDNAPTVHDPFCGGGSIPFETQRLGLKAVGSDLNPVAVLITKALIELPPKFADRPPNNPDADPMGITSGKGRQKQKVPWRGTTGLASDIRYYGKRMRDEAFKRIGHAYPRATLPDGSKNNVIAWLWARTVPCPNPACGINMPLKTTFQLSKKRNNEHWVRPIIDRDANSISFRVQNHDRGVPKNGTVNRNGATCLACGNTVKLPYVREQSKAGHLGEQMIAIVVEGDRKRVYLSPDEGQLKLAINAKASWKPIAKLPEKALGFRLQNYGFNEWHQLFTDRQLLALTTFSDLMRDVRTLIIQNGAEEEYADAICTYLSFAHTKMATRNCAYNRWDNTKDIVVGLFSRQVLSMNWDHAEANPFSMSNGSFLIAVDGVSRNVEKFLATTANGKSVQSDARSAIYSDKGPMVVTDPPYYDNIGYSDLSDFFYVWLRPMLRDVYPDLFAGILTPKSEEMVAAPLFDNPKQWFENALLDALKHLQNNCSGDYPSSIFYAYKQQEVQHGSHASTGWETILNSIVAVNFQIVGTWPMRTELANRQRSLSANSLATSVVLVCRPRPEDARVATRQNFFDELNTELPIALDRLTRDGHIAPADLPQAAIGPGMEVYSKYRRVETISGELVPVREALQQINRVISEYLNKQEGELDDVSRFCVDWIKIRGYKDGPFGEAEDNARPKGLSVSTIGNIHNLINAERGIVQLHPIAQYHPDRKPPMTDMTAWEGCMRMAYHLDTSNEKGEGIPGCGKIGRLMAGNLDSVERLAHILYNHYDNQNQPRNAYIYNQLVSEWQNILDEVQRPERPTLV